MGWLVFIVTFFIFASITGDQLAEIIKLLEAADG